MMGDRLKGCRAEIEAQRGRHYNTRERVKAKGAGRPKPGRQKVGYKNVKEVGKTEMDD